MTTVTYDDIITPSTTDGMRAALLALLADAEFPTTSWQSTSVPRALVEVEGITLADLTTVIADIGKGGYLDYAEDDWLTLLADSVYSVTRKDAETLVGTVRFTNETASPIDVEPGQIVATDSDFKFTTTNTANVTIAGGAYADIVVNAEGPGADWNVGNGEVTEQLTPIPGITVNNPAVGSTGTWITTQGVDEETDAALRLRCRARWGSLGSGGTSDAYYYWATTASSQVTRVRVLENTPSGGQVTVMVAGESGAITDAAELVAIFDYIDLRRPLCVLVYVSSATNRLIVLTGEISVSAAYASTAPAAVENAMKALFRGYDIGARVEVAEIAAAIKAVPGVVNVGLLNESGTAARLVDDDFVMTNAQIPTYLNSFTYRSV